VPTAETSADNKIAAATTADPINTAIELAGRSGMPARYP
jgi:hypothetical protein